MTYPNLFKNRYPEGLRGRDWINRVMPEDQKAFQEIGLDHALHGVLGGIARAKTGKRDNRGRFIRRNLGLIQ
jgi:hypothetical protein